MCEPTTIAATAMVVGTGAQMYGQYQQHQAAEAQAQAQTRMYQRNRENSYEALTRQYSDIGQRQNQEREAAAQEKEEIYRQQRAAMARARVTAGEAGVSGNSVKLGLRDISGAAARDRSTLDRNFTMTMQQLQTQKMSARTNAINRVNSVQPGQEPSTGALVAGMGATAAQGVANVSSTMPKNNPYSAPKRGGTYRGGYFKNG